MHRQIEIDISEDCVRGCVAIVAACCYCLYLHAVDRRVGAQDPVQHRGPRDIAERPPRPQWGRSIHVSPK